MESTEGINVLLLIVLGTLGMLTLASVIIVFVVFYQKRALAHSNKLREKETLYQKQLLEATIEVTELERKKIATNIHDDVGIALNVIKLNLTKIKRNKENIHLVEELLETNDALLEDTITTIRSIAHDLMPASLVKLGFIKGVSELCRQISGSGLQQVNLITNETEVAIEKRKEIHLYRLCKEILNNIIKHANATLIEVRITSINKKLEIEITHNGKGITDDEVKYLIEANKGVGLRSIFSRAQLTESVIKYIVTPNESKVLIETPIV